MGIETKQKAKRLRKYWRRLPTLADLGKKTKYKVRYSSAVRRSFNRKNERKAKGVRVVEKTLSAYQEFLLTPEWKKFREKILAEKCSCCPRRKQLQVHHLDYSKSLFDETNVITLCRDCHDLIHRRHKESPQHTLAEITELVVSGQIL